MTWTPGGYPPGGYQPAGAGPPPSGRPVGVVAPGVGLIIVGVVNFAFAGVYLIVGLSNVGGSDFDTSVQAGDTAGALGYVVGSVFPILCLVLAPATISGGAQLIRGRTRGLVMLGTIAAIVPLSSCCFLAGIPVGIWALIVVRRPDVRAWFDRGGGGGQPAPQYYQPWG